MSRHIITRQTNSVFMEPKSFALKSKYSVKNFGKNKVVYLNYNSNCKCELPFFFFIILMTFTFMPEVLDWPFILVYKKHVCGTMNMDEKMGFRKGSVSKRSWEKLD